MADQTAPPDIEDAACWQCSAPAQADCAYVFRLIARSRRELDAHGNAVKRGPKLDEVRVLVPRCEACRARSRLSIVILFGAAIIGAVAWPALLSRSWPGLTLPSWIHVGSWRHPGWGSPANIFGLVLGLVIALLGVAWRDHRAGIRRLDRYPPIKALKQEGWRFPA